MAKSRRSPAKRTNTTRLSPATLKAIERAVERAVQRAVQKLLDEERMRGLLDA